MNNPLESTNIWRPVLGAIRVQRRLIYESDERSKWVYVVQQQWMEESTDETKWEDVPLVGEHEEPLEWPN